MEICSVLTCIILKTYRDPELEKQFSRIIKVPFLPYQIEGRHFYLYIKSSKDDSGKSLSCKVKSVFWNSRGSTEGEWKMCIETKATRRDFNWIADLIKEDCLLERIDGRP